MNSFIKTLQKEGRIKIVEPSEVVTNSYMEKSQKSLLSAKIVSGIHNFDDAVALTYYSMYYSALALLYRCGIKSENHAGTIILLKELFRIDNTSITNAKKERIDKQYYTEFKATEKDVQEGVKEAEEFNSLIKNFIDKIKKTEIEGYNKKAKLLLK